MSTVKTIATTLVGRRVEFGLLLVAALITAVALANLELSQGNELTSDMLVTMGGFIVVFALAHIVLCFTAPHSDQILLPVAALLNGLGLVIIYRLNEALASRQVLWTLVGVAMMSAVMILLPSIKVLSQVSYILGLVGLVLLALPMVWPKALKGDLAADADLWITLGPISVQPGEFSKILLLLFFAQLLTMKRELFTVAGYNVMGIEFPRLRDLGPILAVWGIALVIMAGENDFGPALLLFGTVLGMLYLATGRASWLLIGGLLAALGGTAIFFISAKIQARVGGFLDPLSDPTGTTHQLSQALFGMSWGGITGTGLGQGHPEFVSVVFSDFILAAVGEELGLVGLAAILLLYAIFISRGFRTALLVRDSYGKLVASGLALTLAIQVFVVVGGISAMLPMTGLTTPFMSAGGSALMANYILLGLLLRTSDEARRPGSTPLVAA
ncbi:cell division protein FtsW [Corynebacterium sp. 13CS0277]|uniref:FtsW/RodA/SpoVE family cell cycle protein n=1 Tax=Corynebacterium sp. 13CS0277 TaxID=2071994 RepID=UPI000D03124B|nr:FtsW/RodA/SpoVE family cell cycle protein [Corynebacterium sp. 13CS0277]PRQ10441.1 cell division protein FtsW [Corynebacterium sp. 13CS0277]